MLRAELERKLLAKLASGELDGIVGHDVNFGLGIIHRQMIGDGIPCFLEIPTPSRANTMRPRVVKQFETDEGKLWYLRNAGWKMDDMDARVYSKLYKRPGGV